MSNKAETDAIREKEASATTEIVFDGPYFKVQRDYLIYKDLSNKIWDVVIHPGAVGILPIDCDSNLILVQQWRHHIQQISLEIPMGRIDPGEMPADAALRELREETGFSTHHLIPFGGSHTTPGLTNEYLHLYLCKELFSHALTSDDTHKIEVKVVTLNEALGYIKEGMITNSVTILAILRYAHEYLHIL
jgi:ADP-ribose pyrophosphatase